MGIVFACCLLYCIPSIVVAEPVHEMCVAYAFSRVSTSLLHERQQMRMQRAVYADPRLIYAISLCTSTTVRTTKGDYALLL